MFDLSHTSRHAGVVAYFKDETGNRHGRLTVLRDTLQRRNRATIWLCKCDCGNLAEISGCAMRRGTVISCGCYRREINRRRPITHGGSVGGFRSPLYAVWCSMRDRCLLKGATYYCNYGGRGIRIDSAWDTFEQFQADMGSTWKQGLTLDRIDNNGPYSKSNCRWATRMEQSNNTRRNRYLTHQGDTLTISQWARKLGINVNTLWKRLNKGWPLARALTR